MRICMNLWTFTWCYAYVERFMRASSDLCVTGSIYAY